MTATIAALSSGAGKAGVAVVRLSGPAVAEALRKITGIVPPPRLARLRRLRSETGEEIDRGLVLFLPGPASFTGEDVAEFQVHGGRAVVAALLEALTAIPDIRLAEPGEFTRRAVENGKLDLTAAEGIADLVEAETAGQRRQALRQAGGVLERAAFAWRAELARALALLEAEIDFPDEEDVPALFAAVTEAAARLRTEVEAALAGAARGERLREGARIVIAGPPNAGKSTLLNALARRDVAIVSAIPGTTRDAIEVHLDLDGYPATLVDTAGLRQTEDPVEAIGVARALDQAGSADLVVWLSPVDAPAEPPDLAVRLLRVATKVDRTDSVPQRCDLSISALTGAGLDALTDRLAQAAQEALEGGEAALVTRARHRRELEAMAAHLSRVAAADAATPVEFVAEDLRLAVRAIGRLTGSVDIDEIYDLIFRQFCIGK